VREAGADAGSMDSGAKQVLHGGAQEAHDGVLAGLGGGGRGSKGFMT
jgi:hypothetical protein